MIDDHLEGFEEHDVLLQLSLGLLSAGKHLDRMLARHTKVPASRTTPPFDDPRDRELIEFVLGLITLHDNLRVTLSATPVPGYTAATTTQHTSLAKLLR